MKRPKKKYCINGHRYTHMNTKILIRPDGRVWYRCRRCHNAVMQRNYRAKRLNPERVEDVNPS
jgi:hypothetical protein